MLQLAAVVAAVFGVAVLRVVVAEAVVFAVLRFFGALSVAPIAFVAATLRVDRGISLSAASWPASRPRFEFAMAAGETQRTSCA